MAAPPHPPKSCPRETCSASCLAQLGDWVPAQPQGDALGGCGLWRQSGDTDPGAPGKVPGTWAGAWESAPSWGARAGSPGWDSAAVAEPWRASWQGSFFPSDLTVQFTMVPTPSGASWAEPGLLMDILEEKQRETDGGHSISTLTKCKLPFGAHGRKKRFFSPVLFFFLK